MTTARTLTVMVPREIVVVGKQCAWECEHLMLDRSCDLYKVDLTKADGFGVEGGLRPWALRCEQCLADAPDQETPHYEPEPDDCDDQYLASLTDDRGPMAALAGVCGCALVEPEGKEEG